MELRKINLKDAVDQWEYTTTLPEDENGLTNPYHGVSLEEYMESVLPTLISYEHPVNMPDWFVPETYYYLWDEDNLIGEFRIRHHLTEALRNGAGHIGYSIGKSYRGKGYGTAGLGLTIQLAKDIVPEEEIYLRVNKDNLASQKCMLANGAYKAGEDAEHYFMRIPKKLGIIKEGKMSRFTVDRDNAPSVEEIMEALNDDIVEYIFDDYSLYIEFSEEGNAFVGWINTYDEENYYFDNGSGNTEMVELKVNVCPEERMMCYDAEALKEIVLYFCETGEMNPKYNWIEDQF